VSAAVSAISPGRELPDLTFDAVAVADARRLFTLALSILRDDGEAEDAVQETLLRAWRSWETVSRMERPAAWLTRVCVNHCISRRRMLRSRGWPPLTLVEDEAVAGMTRSEADLMDMERAYRRLSLKQRAALTLNYRHGYAVEECAVLMGCRPGTVRTHIARGLATLRKELGND
jgi:RNA polymerase sigma factor (sigma-70 family)